MSFLNCPELPTRFSCKSKVRTVNNVDFNITQKTASKSKFRDTLTFLSSIKDTRIQGNSSIQTITNVSFNPYRYAKYTNGRIQSVPVISGVIRSILDTTSNIPDITADKFAGELNFNAYEKLYPIRDISVIDLSDNSDVSNFIHSDTDDIYSSIDEGVITNDYTQNNKISSIASDDAEGKIYVDNLLNDNSIEFKFEITTPIAVAKQSYFAVRTLSPTPNYLDRIPSIYRIYDIKLEDPFGNLIIQYNDIGIRGDHYYTTYISNQLHNNLLLPTWDVNYPLMEEPENYTLRFKLGFACESNAFTDKFNPSFEQGCIKSIDGAPNPLKDIYISSIEIGNSGGVGILRDNYIGLWSFSKPSQKVTKFFIPTELLSSTFTNSIYPESVSVWESYPNELTNQTISGSEKVLEALTSPFETRYISLISSSLHPDSGKLVLKFTNTHASISSLQYIDGGFQPGFGGGSFFTAKPIDYQKEDIYFDADSIKLEIFAKKASENVPDFPLDVVGYSDDKILCVTSSVGGFLQNDKSIPYQANDIPDVTGIDNISNAISENPLSYDSDFYSRDISLFGDHYHVTTDPLVNTTEFKKYTVPLKIYYNENVLGKQPIFSLSNFLDNLYLDIAPLPTGAIISYIRLVIDHNPSDALTLTTLGGTVEEIRKVGSKTVTLLPNKDSTKPVNKSGLLTNIPHGFSSPNNLKTNYSRRWRGTTNDILVGAFSPIEFDNYQFEFDFATTPFLYGYTNFSKVNEYEIYDNKGLTKIADFAGFAGDAIEDHLLHNIGWRLSDEQLFNNLPSTPYKSIAWRENIYDAFDRSVRVSGSDYYLDCGSIVLSAENGWAIFLRFTPDNIIPDNQCIWSYKTSTDVIFQLKYVEGRLTATVDNGNITIQDNANWSDYQYPLSVLVTYSENEDYTLKLFTDNELSDSYSYLAAESDPFSYLDLSANLSIGHCGLHSDTDLPMFVHEFGISNTKCNLVTSLDPDTSKLNQELSIEEFFRSHRMHFSQTGDVQDRSDQYQYIDDDISKWKLGAFKICAFSADFDYFTARDGDKYLLHNIVSDGTSYFNKIALNLQKDTAYNIDDRIANTDPNVSKNIFSTKNHNNSIYVRNVNCWASDLDLTCLSPWNSAGQEVMGGVLVSPRHVIFCRHSSHYPPAGSTIRFVNNNNEVVEATIISETDIGWDVRETSSWDFTIAYLDRDVTALGISVAKILPDNYNQYFEPWSYGSEPILNNKKPIPFELPTLFVDPEDKALVMELEVIKSVKFLYSETSADWVIEAGLSPLFSALKSQDNTRLAFFENVVGGDSGSGSFLIINDTLVLIGVSTSGGEGTSGPALIAEAKDRINTAMNALAIAQGDSTYYELNSINLDIYKLLNLSNVNYHTQVENDFLRFNLSNIPNYDPTVFYSARPRISKNLPKNYNFNEESICVDTILEYDTNNDIVWDNGKIGPKFIVSLYSPILNHPDRPSKDFGLINRSIHHLEPSGCFQKFTSTFNFDDLIDTSEPWALFDKEIYSKEFKERFFSTELNEMFLQYDLVYPSGDSFNATIKLHNANVRIDKALGFYSNIDNQDFCLYASGDQYWYDSLDFVLPNVSTPISDSGLVFYTSGNVFTVSQSLFLSVLTSDGYYVEPQYLAMFKNAKGVISTFGNFGSSLFGSSYGPSLSFYTSGEFLAEQSLPIYVSGETKYIENYVSMYNAGKDGYYDFQVENKLSLSISAFDIPDFISINDIGLFVSGFQPPITVTNDCPIWISGYNPDIGDVNNSLSLFTINYEVSTSTANKLLSVNWNAENAGQEVLLIDQSYLSVDQDDNIRGVDIICNGECNIYNINQCAETPVTIHGDTWYEDDCINGGIFRAKTTYTNLVFDSGIFKNNGAFISEINPITNEQTIFYSGHYYGARKFTGLAPNLPYNLIINAKTGSSESIEIPKQFVEVEYNKLEQDYIDSDGVTSLMDYNGITLVSNDENRVPASKFGKSIAIKGDTLLVGCPLADITYVNSDDETIELNEAGTVFVYKREARPEGYEWPVDKFKSPWILEDVLSLPNSVRADYAVRLPEDNILIDPARSLYLQKTRWFTGQDHRHFGHSVDLAKKGSREIAVVGGPSAGFSRVFDDIEAEIVNIGLAIFIDKFDKTTFVLKPGIRGLVELTYLDIIAQIENKDLIFEYFANPKARFNVTIILYVTTADSVNNVNLSWDDAPSTLPLKIVVQAISRNNPEFTIEQNNTRILNGLKAGFNKAFPLDGNQRFNGIPPILGLYVDASESFIGAIPEATLNEFIDFYKEEAFNAGMSELDPPAYGQVAQFFTDNEIQAENWILLATGILDDLLDFDNLDSRQQTRFITNELRDPPPGSTRSDYNILPDSGGRVYIFQNENNSWNLIQEIRSPNISYNYPDQFGHCVSISADTELIGIGSPYINEAVSMFEYKPEETQRYYNSLYFWINLNSERVFRYTNALDKFAIDNNSYELYLSLTPDDKFKSRLDLNINEYQKIYILNHSDVQVIGSWGFIPIETAPSSRLGYSLDINDDGSKVVIGAPTDSMNLFNDADVYYVYEEETVPGGCEGNYQATYFGDIAGIRSCWASSVNAGSIYVLESRKYYPHDTVMEYGRFGNLHRRISESNPESEDNGHFDYIQQIFEDKMFIRTGQSVNEIPQNVGLLFIITPEEDVLSEEVVTNIINWLALGDRNLVLVGNDPIWEQNGAYKISNDVINKLLRRLNSRMQLKPAKSRVEAASNGYTDFDNVVTSHLPYGSTPSYVNRRVSLKGSGVADIKMYYGDSSTDYRIIMEQNCREVSTCMDPDIKYQIQDKCEMPLAHGGDLRAEWEQHCCDERGRDYIYYQNWPLFFGSYKPACADEEIGPSALANREAVPLLTVAEKVKKTIVVPTVPAKSGVRLIYDDLIIGQEYTRFFDPEPTVFENNELSLIWTNDIFPSSIVPGSGSVDLNFTQNTQATFTNPEGESLLEGFGALRINDISSEVDFVIDPLCRFCVSQKYPNKNTSEVVLIAGVALESAASLDGLTGVVETDKNIKFYRELVNNYRMLAQLSLFNNNTEPATFKQAYSESIIADILKNILKVRQGVSPDKLLNGDTDANGTLNQFDIAWISNVAKYEDLNSDTINNLKTWLNRGNKKLIITFDFYYSIESKFENLNKVKRLCEALGLSIKPLEYRGQYQDSVGGQSVVSIDRLNEEYDVSPIGNSYNPINAIGDNVKTISFQKLPITTIVNVISNGNYWYMNTGTTKVSFPAEPNKGYRLFFETKKYDDDTKIPLQILIGNANTYPKPIQDEIFPFSIYDFNNSTYELDVFNPMSEIVGNASPIDIKIDGVESVDVQVGDGKNSIDIYISANYARLSAEANSLTPKTLSLIAVSGIEIPITTTVSTTVVPGGGDFLRFEEYEISPEIPGYTVELDFIRPISHQSQKYCNDRCSEAGLGQYDIEDGPIVAAQEIEFITAFDAGHNRSRVTLLSDSSLIQGRYLKEGNSLSQEHYSFIRSLYPETYFDSTNFGRQFTIKTKLISPERGSVTKHLQYDNSINTRTNFGNFAGIKPNSNDVRFFQYESQYDPKLVRRPDTPWECHDEEEKIAEVRLSLISGFYSEVGKFGCYPRLSGVINDNVYIDVGITGGIPEIMIHEGYDYLDLDKFTGYPGDLFGYSVAIQDDLILVGSPFAGFNNGENIGYWIPDTEFYLGEDGGPGAVYMFKKTGFGSGINNTLTAWECVKKLRPNTLMGQLSGINTYSDQFGRSVAIKDDIIAIGAPNHNYSTYYSIINSSGDFVRKSFDESFLITKRTPYDLGNSGIRNDLSKNDIYGDNAGAIYTYENKITDWENKLQDWTEVDKVTANNNEVGNDNEKFGKTIYLDKTNRSDSDYVLLAGCDTAAFGEELDVGVVYNKDIMIRYNPPATQNPDANIFIKLMGKTDPAYPPMTLSFSNDNFNSKSYFASGVLRSTAKGEIFLEVSGQDPSTKGFIAHRPYVESIIGSYKYGTLVSDDASLFTEGAIGPATGNLPLFIDVETSGNVYNNLGLYNCGISGVSDAILGLYSHIPEPNIIENDSFVLYVSGIL